MKDLEELRQALGTAVEIIKKQHKKFAFETFEGEGEDMQITLDCFEKLLLKTKK